MEILVGKELAYSNAADLCFVIGLFSGLTCYDPETLRKIGTFDFPSMHKVGFRVVELISCDWDQKIAASHFGAVEVLEIQSRRAVLLIDQDATDCNVLGLDRIVSSFDEAPRVVTGDMKGNINLFHSETGQKISGLCVLRGGGINRIEVFHQSQVFVGADEGIVAQFDVHRPGEILNSFEGHYAAVPVSGLAMHDDKCLISASWDRTVRLWDTKSRHCEDILELDAYGVSCLCHSAKKRLFVGSVGRVEIWDLRNVQNRLGFISGFGGPVDRFGATVNDICCVKSESFIAVSRGIERNVIRFDVEGRVLKSVGHPRSCYGVCVSSPNPLETQLQKEVMCFLSNQQVQTFTARVIHLTLQFWIWVLRE